MSPGQVKAKKESTEILKENPFSLEIRTLDLGPRRPPNFPVAKAKVE